MQDPQDNVFQLILQLKDIVDQICAQQISKAQVACLDVLIQEYWHTKDKETLRMKFLPNKEQVFKTRMAVSTGYWNICHALKLWGIS